MGLVMTLPRSRPLTCADLEAVPDDGHRYELVDGTLIVSPAPSPLHQRAVGRLFRVLDNGRPAHLEVLMAPLDVYLAEDTLIQPDLVVARRSDLTEHNLPAAPVLAVEVLSPSTRGIDLLLKRELLQRAGCPSYWVVDPDEPSLLALNLKDGIYAQAGFVTGDEVFQTGTPFDVSVTPDLLIAP